MIAKKNEIPLHVAKTHQLLIYLFKFEEMRFVWVRADNPEKVLLEVQSKDEAMSIPRKTWKESSFRFLGCGFRYTLPERDEHGTPALFYQMVASYRSSNGVYFDDDLGNNCIVHNASLEALDLMEKNFGH